MNALWGDCAAGLTCVGVPADGSYGACAAGFEPMTLGGLCYCAPASG